MDMKGTALILIGFQNDYFADDGILHHVIEAELHTETIVERTVRLIERLMPTPVLIISTPIIFTSNYRELTDPMGVLKIIKDAEAFRAGTRGAETIPEIRRFGGRVLEVPGKRGLNAFSNTELDEILRRHGINHVILAGVVTSICIDSTARAAHELNYKVSVLSDCTAGRTAFEQSYYCREILPLYADVMTSDEILGELDD